MHSCSLCFNPSLPHLFLLPISPFLSSPYISIPALRLAKLTVLLRYLCSRISQPAQRHTLLPPSSRQTHHRPPSLSNRLLRMDVTRLLLATLVGFLCFLTVYSHLGPEETLRDDRNLRSNSSVNSLDFSSVSIVGK